MNKLNLVVVPFHDWKKCEREGFRTRDAHFMQEFGKHPAIDKLLIVNRPISLSEIILLRRNWHVKQGRLLQQKKGVYLAHVLEKTFTIDILIPEVVKPVFMQRNWIPYIFGKSIVVDAIQSSLRQLGMDKSYALFISEPLFVPLAQQLSPKALILDAQDNLLKHPLYQNVLGLKEYYEFCQDHADLIYANSAETAQWLGQKRPDATHIPNGVDIERFNPACEHPTPEDILPFSRPIIGYAGKMQELFDVDLLLAAANAIPEATFVCIGQLLNPKQLKSLWGCRNIYYLGDKHYTSLPDYLHAFDICIIPARMSKQHGGDPIKFYEYLAMGKPIVTTNIGGVSAFANFPQVKVVTDAPGFIAALKHFLTLIRTGGKLPFAELPIEVLWSTKADIMIKAIQQKVSKK